VQAKYLQSALNFLNTMKYRRFSPSELSTLEPDFVRFLALNGIPADEWERMKATQNPQVEELIDQFSDAVFERTLQDIEYLEFRLPKDIKTFHCQKEKIVLMGLVLDGDTEIDFGAADSVELIAQKMQEGQLHMRVYTAEKAYQNNDREAEIFRMLENGALIAKGGWMFELLAAQLEQKN